jgi:Skp family chaperone for outer membrane proteins
MPRSLLSILVATLCFAMSATAGDTAAGRTNSAPPVRSVAKPAAEKSGVEKNVPKEKGAGTEKTAAPARPEGAALEAEIQQLKELLLEQKQELEAQRALLNEQQKKVQALEKQFAARGGDSGAAPLSAEGPGLASRVDAVASEQDELNQKVGKIATDLDNAKKSLEGKIKGFGPFTFSGDLRVRSESVFGGLPLSGPAGEAQFRQRYRLRLNAVAKFNDEFSGGFSLASGDLNNPVSANQSINQFYIRRPIGIDRAFIAYAPRWFKPLTVTAGKFAYTWNRTELIWDNDLNPEGVSEALHWNWKDSFLQHIGLVALQMPFNSTFGASGTTVAKVLPSGATFGGQIQSNWKFSDHLKFGAHVGYFHFRNADQLAQGQATGVIGGNGQTNYVGTIGSGSSATTLFASNWGILDAIVRLDVTTGISRFPLMLQLDYAQNTQACQNGASFVKRGGTAPFCDPRERHAYWAEAQIGRTQEQGDIRFGYTFMRIERDSVLSAWTFDDKRQATNLAQHRMEMFYQAYKQITVGMTGFFGRQLVTATSPTATVAPEHILRRFQFDLVYKF